MRQILERIKRERGKQFGIMMEYFCEYYLDLCDAQMLYPTPEVTDSAFFSAIYSGYAVMSGASTHRWRADDVTSFRIKVGRRFLWGNQLGRSYFSEHLLDVKKAQFLRDLVWMRAKSRKFLTYGEMLRPPRWEIPVPRVKAEKYFELGGSIRSFLYDAVEMSLWKAPDGDIGVFIVNYSDKSQKVTFRCSFLTGDYSTMKIITPLGEKEKGKITERQKIDVKLLPAQVMCIEFRRGRK